MGQPTSVLAWVALGQLPLPVPSSHYRLTINLD